MGYRFKNIDISRYLFIIFIPVHNITSNDNLKKYSVIDILLEK